MCTAGYKFPHHTCVNVVNTGPVLTSIMLIGPASSMSKEKMHSLYMNVETAIISDSAQASFSTVKLKLKLHEEEEQDNFTGGLQSLNT